MHLKAFWACLYRCRSALALDTHVSEQVLFVMMLADQLPAAELPDLQLQVVLVGPLQPLVLRGLVLADTLLVVPAGCRGEH